MNPDWTKPIKNWGSPMRSSLKTAIQDHISGASRFDDLTIKDIQACGSRYWGELGDFKNGNALREKVSDCDIQVYCHQSAVNWGTGFEYHGVHVAINIKTKPLAGADFVTYAMGHRKRSAGYNLPVRSLKDDVAYGDLTHGDIALWKSRND